MTGRKDKSKTKETPRLSLKERQPKGLQHLSFAEPKASEENNEQRTFAPSFLEGSVADQTLETPALQTYEQRKTKVDPLASEVPANVIEHLTNEMLSLSNQLACAQRVINNKIVLFCAPLLALNAWIGIWAWT